MRCGYFDCFSGAAGDMILAAMVHAGLPVDTLQDVITRLRLPGVVLQTALVQRGGLSATHVKVDIGPEARKNHRHLPDILAIIDAAGLSGTSTQRARRVFTRLAEAEATVHGVAVEKIHFHEVGAADAIVDIVGACVGVEALGLETITCSPIPTGSGTVECEHGTLPVPAPATAELLRGVPLAACDEPGELTTPTAAALLTTLADSFGPMPPMQITSIGYGAGTRENRSRPNVLRLLIGDQVHTAPDEEDRVVVLETQVDDATGQTIAFAIARLLEAGALDACALPIVMKKGRPGQLLSVLCSHEAVSTLEEILFSETTTFGIRQYECVRHKLAREHVAVQTQFGPIRVKVGRRGQRVMQAWPEFDDCAAAAHEKGVSLRVVQDAALREWTDRYGGQHDRRDG